MSIYSEAIVIGTHFSQGTEQEQHVAISTKVSFASILFSVDLEVSRLTL